MEILICKVNKFHKLIRELIILDYRSNILHEIGTESQIFQTSSPQVSNWILVIRYQTVSNVLN